MSFSSLKMSRPRSSDSERALQRMVSAREAPDSDTLHGLGLAEAKLSGSGGVMKVTALAFFFFFFFFPKQELLGFSIHTTTGRWTR